MSAELMKSTSVWRPSVRRPSVCVINYLSLTFLHGFLSNFRCGFLWAICLQFFFIYKYFSFSLAWDPMGKKFQNATPLTNRSLNLSWIFFLMVLTNVQFGIFEILSLPFFLLFFFAFINMGPYRSKIFKTVLLPQITKVLFWIFEIWVSDFFRKFQIYHCSLWISQKPQLSRKRAIVE